MSKFYLKTDGADFGPIPYEILREWLYRNMVPQNAMVREAHHDGRALPLAGIDAYTEAGAIPRLWMIGDRAFTIEQPPQPLMSEKLPISRELNRYLRETMGWPFSTNHLSYWAANRLRVQIEKAIPGERPLLNDPDWPWSGGSPAEAHARWSAPMSESEAGLIDSLGGTKTESMTKMEACIEIDRRMELLGLERNSLRPRQRMVFRFWGKSTRGYSKSKASAWITELYEKNPDAKSAWEAYKTETNQSKSDIDYTSIPLGIGNQWLEIIKERRRIAHHESYTCEKSPQETPKHIPVNEALHRSNSENEAELIHPNLCAALLRFWGREQISADWIIKKHKEDPDRRAAWDLFHASTKGKILNEPTKIPTGCGYSWLEKVRRNKETQNEIANKGSPCNKECITSQKPRLFAEQFEKAPTAALWLFIGMATAATLLLLLSKR